MTDDLLCLKRMLVGEGLRVATAESCTGGSLADALTSIPGSSDYFVGGVVAYSVEVKVGVLGVNPETVEQFSVYSYQVVEEMAEGIRRLTGADVAIATSGEFNGEGYFYYCILHPRGKDTGRVVVEGSRREMKGEAVRYILRRLLKVIAT
ncbi:MAG: CinA family protein [Thermotogae bacterium]|nr:CinA family protein [Thermotogota bacterium]